MRRRLSLIAALLALVMVGACASAWLIPLPQRLSEVGSTVVFYRDGTPAHVFLSPDERWRIPVHRSEVDPHYQAALLRLEDKRFRHHPGVDPIAIVRAAISNVSQGRVVSGASTLTMQLVRMVEPRPRTLRSKVIEALRAVQLELRLSKDQILEAYLQFLPFGRNIEGVEAACLAYFGHRAGALSAAEIATLLAVPQNPNARYPSADNAPRLKAARDDIAARLFAQSALPVGQGESAVSPAAALKMVTDQDAPATLRPFPRHAPHAALWLRAQRPGTLRIHSTLDAGVQRLAERQAHSSRARVAGRGIHNIAVVILDHERREILALVGSFDFWEEGHGGQIPAFAVPRAVGSTLKPFLYAMSIDRGLALPEHLVPDVPMSFGTYAPQNYDGGYDGLVRLEDALSRSLNVPFVGMLKTLGVEPFLGLLRGMGVRTLRAEPGYYGLSVAAGGIELAPIELAGMYATLAQGGYHRPVVVITEGPEGDEAPLREGIPVLSEGATWLTRRALSLRDRPDFPARGRITRAPPQIHWKTGTSFGHRDAWAVGSGPQHTALVWMGNVDNTPSAALVGAEASGPLLFDLLEALADGTRPLIPLRPPTDLKTLTVCAWSGHLPTDACPSQREVLARRQSVPMSPCPYHVTVDVDTQTGLALSPRCRAGRDYETQRFLNLPAQVRRWLSDGRRPLPGPPTYAPGCEVVGTRRRPSILFPGEGHVVILMDGLAASEQELALEAETPAAGARLSWFADGVFLGTVEAEGRVWWEPSEGRHELMVVDEAGLSASRWVEVRRGR